MLCKGFSNDMVLHDYLVVSLLTFFKNVVCFFLKRVMKLIEQSSYFSMLLVIITKNTFLTNGCGV